ncbi:hypothetical protein [Tessaracoccus sp. Z1128]
MDLPRLARDTANVVNLSTPLGLALAVVGRARLRRRGHLIVADRARLPIHNAGAVTIGSVVLIPHRSAEEVEASTPTLMEHEDGHAWQYAYSLGLPFLPLYGLATLWSMVRTGDRASANYFEVQADLLKGGYRINPTMPVGSGIRRLLSRGAAGRSGRPAAGRASDAGA